MNKRIRGGGTPMRCLFAFLLVTVATAVIASSALGAGGMTEEQLTSLPGHNKMVWVRTPSTKAPPVLDGTLDLDSGEWADACCVPGMIGWRAQGGILMPIPCRTYVTWDADNFYIGMRTGVLPGGVLKRDVRGDEEEVHKDDGIEIFFDPLGRDQPEFANFQVMFNALGVCWDAMQSVGVIAKYWDGNWQMKSDYEIGMDHFDAEIIVPVASMRMQSPNASGDCWRFLACRDWKRLVDERGESIWNVYSSFTGWGGFSRPENHASLVLDDTAPVVQLLDIAPLWQGKLGFEAALGNPGAVPVECKAEVVVLANPATAPGTQEDWFDRDGALVSEAKTITIPAGGTATWSFAPKELPPLEPASRGSPSYDFAFRVTMGGGKALVYRRQCSFRKVEYTAKTVEYELPMSVRYNPVRHNVLARCDVLDDPNRDRAGGLRVRVFERDADPGTANPMCDNTITVRRHNVYEGVLEIPELQLGDYPVRLTLLDKAGEPIESRDLSITKLDEAAEFKWWNSRAGVTDRPIPPHESMRYEQDDVVTTMGRYRFAGSAMPAQVTMAGEELLVSPVRLTASVDGSPVSFSSPRRAERRAASGMEAEFSGSLESRDLDVLVDTHMEYDGAMRITLDVKAGRELSMDYLRLEIPFKPARAQWMWTMARAGRESWVAADLGSGEGAVWDSRNCRGYGLAVGTFMPQYVVSDSLRGLCWFADSDRGWVPTDDVPATEALRGDGETVLRMNLIAKPFVVRGDRRIDFWLLGLPARPLPGGWRIYQRVTSNFGHYVGDKVMNYSAPMPRDFDKARAFMVEGTVYDKTTHEPRGKSTKWSEDFEFAPWHDTHTAFRTPDLNEATYSYFGLEFGAYGFVPALIDLRCYQWDRYCKTTPIAGIYFDTPEAMGFSKNLSNGTGYIIPEGQPHAGEIQAGYQISAFREYVKRIRGVFYQNGRDNTWVEMHSTHGPIAPTTGFLDIRTEGEDYRTPTYRHFMHAWSIPHLRALDVPQLFGLTTRWLNGYPWDGSVEGADPLRSQIGACIIHDIWSHWGRWHDTSLRGGRAVDQPGTTREGPYGWRHPNMETKLIALGMNRDEVRYLPYWSNGDVLEVSGPADNVLADIRASAWHIPSQDRLFVAVGNWNEHGVGSLQVTPDLEKLGLMPDVSGVNLVVMDVETDAVLQRSTHLSMGKLYGLRNREPGRVAITLDPIDFRLLMFAKQ